MELLIKPEMLTSYIYVYGPTFGNAESRLYIFCTMFQHWINAESYPMSQLCVNTLSATKVNLITDGIQFGSLRVKSMIMHVIMIIRIRKFISLYVITQMWWLGESPLAALVKFFNTFSFSSKTWVDCCYYYVFERVTPHNCCHNKHCCFFVCYTVPGMLVKSHCNFQSKDCWNFLC
jgi:hypothetical protein